MTTPSTTENDAPLDERTPEEIDAAAESAADEHDPFAAAVPLDTRSGEEVDAAAESAADEHGPGDDQPDTRSPDEIEAAAETAGERLTGSDLRLRVFSKNACPTCTSTKRILNKRGVPFDEINVEIDTEPREEFGGQTPLDYVVATYGREMPTLVIEDGEWGESWAGGNPSKLIEVVARFTAAGLIIPKDQRVE